MIQIKLQDSISKIREKMKFSIFVVPFFSSPFPLFLLFKKNYCSKEKNIEYSDFEKGAIIGMWASGKSHREIEGMTGIPHQSVGTIIKNYRENGSVENKEPTSKD